MKGRKSRSCDNRAEFFCFFYWSEIPAPTRDHVWWKCCEWNAVCRASWKWLAQRGTSQKRKTSCRHMLASVSFLALCHCNRVHRYRGLALWKACMCVCLYRPRVLPQSWFSVMLCDLSLVQTNLKCRKLVVLLVASSHPFIKWERGREHWVN